MIDQIVRTGLIALLSVLAVGCGRDVGPSVTPAALGSPCAVPATAAPTGCWFEILPLGSGGFPPAPGSQDKPPWEPGKFPLTLPPRLAFDDELWMTARTVSGDGVTWNRQAEHAPWAPRDPVAIVFRDRIWIYSGKHTGSRDNWGGDLWQMTAVTRSAPP